MDIRAGAEHERQICVDLWLAALEARDGFADAAAVTARARAKFEQPVVRFAVVDETPVAFALTVDAGEHAGARVALLELLAVAPSEAGRGLGRALLADAVRTAEGLGYSRIELHVRAGNTRAERLYASAGFEPVGEPTPHPLGGPPMIQYSREISPQVVSARGVTPAV